MLNRKTLLSTVLGSCIILSSATVWSAPGENTTGASNTPVTFGSLLPIVTESGRISLSVDGAGSNAAGGHTVQVEKPAGATVRGAYLAAASTGFLNFVPTDTEIQIDGNAVAFDFTTPSSIGSHNSWADVTSIVAPIVDAAPAGLIDLQITEANTLSMDGEILAVIFDDPSQTQDNTIVLFFGAQDIEGDSFNIALASPIDVDDPNLVLDFSLGISFGFMPSEQFSLVDVNGERMTSSAGGQDDGVPITVGNGGLITVGGIGDTNDNPPPDAGPAGDARTDDELYNLIPFVTAGDTTITVFTSNPSDDDNIFFSSLVLSDTAIVGEGILLAPLEETKRPLDDHTITALVQDDAGNPVVGTVVEFSIVDGPNDALATVSSTTGDDGRALFTYTSLVTGTDTVVAEFTDSTGNTQTSNTVQVNWRIPEEITHFFCTEDVTFTPDFASLSVSGPSCGGVGTMTFNATMTNVASVDISDLDIIITELSGGNQVCNTDIGAAGVGASITVPSTGGYSDNVLSTLESVDIPFQVALNSLNAFTFFVDVVGVGCSGEPFSFSGPVSSASN